MAELALEFRPSQGGELAQTDVAANEIAAVGGRLERVGMTDIEIPVRLVRPGGESLLTPAKADAFVSLDDPSAKGIHMSRLFLLLQESLEKVVLTLSNLETVLRGFVASHHDMSESAFVELRFDYMIKRPALLSGNSGWRSYPTRIASTLDKTGSVSHDLEVRVAYSSTCPCSAALSREHIARAFRETFGGGHQVEVEDVDRWLQRPEALAATPHSQRSYADVCVSLAANAELRALELIDRVEGVLQTPVQAAVKRVDEQEFARLNGLNPMFCEDAARRIQSSLENDPWVAAYHVRVEHQESLHPHNAVSVARGAPKFR